MGDNSQQEAPAAFTEAGWFGPDCVL